MPKVTGTNRISALKRLGNPYVSNNINRKASVNDARQLLVNRNTTSFDARQLLNRQGSKTKVDDNDQGNMIVVTGLKDMKMKDGRLISKSTGIETQIDKKKTIFAVGPSTFVTIRNKNNHDNTNTIVNQSTEKFSLTKTIVNPSVQEVDDHRSQTANKLSSLSNQKVVISFVNDKYQKTPSPPPPPPIQTTKSCASTVLKRVHDASIQTISTTRSPIRINTHRRQTSTMTDDDEDYSTERTIADDMDEPPVKRTTSFVRKATTNKDSPPVSTTATTTTPIGSVKRTSTGVPVSSRVSSTVTTVTKKPTTTQVVSTPGTILVTNLQPSVTEDDVIELFGEIGCVTEIKTLSQGCVQITYAKREHCEQAVIKYHNRLLDGQFMYVSLQQSVTAEKSKPINSNSQQSTKESGSSSTNNSSSSSSAANQPLKFNTNTSTKSTLDPAFIRQALFHPSNNSTNPVQFQVKL